MSRWARASREDLESLAEQCDQAGRGAISYGALKVLECLRASCPPLRAEAEVAAEALAVLRVLKDRPLTTAEYSKLCALAKEPTR